MKKLCQWTSPISWMSRYMLCVVQKLWCGCRVWARSFGAVVTNYNLDCSVLSTALTKVREDFTITRAFSWLKVSSIIFAPASQFHIYYLCLCALGAFSVIVKSPWTFIWSSTARAAPAGPYMESCNKPGIEINTRMDHRSWWARWCAALNWSIRRQQIFLSQLSF